MPFILLFAGGALAGSFVTATVTDAADEVKDLAIMAGAGYLAYKVFIEKGG
jgi:uncharacterized membrane protein YebE (DUF533 family)